jgi:hypothetical protein
MSSRRPRWPVAVAAATACFLLAACSSKSTTKPPAPAASAAATQAAAATASDGSGASAPTASSNLHACVLVSEQDATTALGADPGVGQEDTQNGDFGGNSRCIYAITSAGVQVSASSIAGKALCDGNRRSNSVDVPGVGDSAFETPATSKEATVYFLKGDTCVSITIETPASMGSAKDRVIALATTAAGRA